MPASTHLSRAAIFAVLALNLSACVVEPLPPEGAPIGYDGCCYAYPEYPTYYYPGPYYPNVYFYGRSRYYGGWHGRGGWRR